MKEVNLIDIEASGLSIDSYPIEVGIFVADKMHSWLINPEPVWTYWNQTAENMHGITREFLLTHGKPARFVADAINDIMSDSNGFLYSDAAAWDADWINTLYTATGAVAAFHVLPVSDLLSQEQWPLFLNKRNELANSGQYRCHRVEADIQINKIALNQVFDEKEK